ncbi:MAG: hypothetical protein ACFHU9_14370 [Fluviicola sp.]
MSTDRTNKDQELDFLMDRRPSIYASFWFMLIFRFLLWLAAVGFFIMGIIFSTSGYLNEASSSVLGELDVENIRWILATSCFLISIALAIAVWIGRMLLRRNAFIIEINTWYKKRNKDNSPKIS